MSVFKVEEENGERERQKVRERQKEGRKGMMRMSVKCMFKRSRVDNSKTIK